MFAFSLKGKSTARRMRGKSGRQGGLQESLHLIRPRDIVIFLGWFHLSLGGSVFISCNELFPLTGKSVEKKNNKSHLRNAGEFEIIKHMLECVVVAVGRVERKKTTRGDFEAKKTPFGKAINSIPQ